MPCQPLYSRVGLSECQLSRPTHTAHTIYKHGTGRGRWGLASQLQQQLGLYKVFCWLPLIASRSTTFRPSSLSRQSVSISHLTMGWLKHSQPASPPPPGDRPTVTVHPHWRHVASIVAYLGSLAYCVTLGGAFDRDHWSRSAVVDVRIIEHIV